MKKEEIILPENVTAIIHDGTSSRNSQNNDCLKQEKNKNEIKDRVFEIKIESHENVKQTQKESPKLPNSFSHECFYDTKRLSQKMNDFSLKLSNYNRP